MEKLTLMKADCLEFLKTLNDNSVDLIATDPPYFRVKKDGWDRQWKNKEDFIEWLETVVKELARVCKPTGSLYLFCGPYLSSETEQLINKHFRVLNHIAWRKPTGRHLGTCIPNQRKFFPQTERIIFAESLKPLPFAYESIRSYLDTAVKSAGLSRADIHQLTNTQMSSHWFGRSQFVIPSKIQYEVMQSSAQNLTMSHDELHSWFCDIRDGEKKGRRTFNAQKGFNTDVWDFSVVQPYPGKHPCEKPLDLMTHIIKTSSRDNDVVLDVFAGSGSTAISAISSGRQFIGCEFGNDEHKLALARINKHLN